MRPVLACDLARASRQLTEETVIPLRSIAPRIVCSLLFATLVASAAYGRPQPRGVKADPSASVVRLFARGDDGVFIPSGSGVFVKKGIVAAPRDALRDGKAVFVRTTTSDVLREVEPVPSVESTGVELFRVDEPAIAPLPLATRSPKPGEAVTAVGARSLGTETSSGVVVTASTSVPIGDSRGLARVFETTAAVTPDSAGGPLVAADGRVIGLTTRFQQPDNKTVLVVPAASVAACLAGKPVPKASAERDESAPASSASPPPSSQFEGTIGHSPLRPDGLPEKPPSGPPVVATKVEFHNAPRAEYTELASNNGTEGVVLLKALTGKDGRVKTVSVIKGLPDGLNEKAIEAILKLQFTPAKNAAGEPIDSWVTVSVRFSLNSPVRGGMWAGEYGFPEIGHVQFVVVPDDNTSEFVHGFVIFASRLARYSFVAVHGRVSGSSFVLRADERVDGCDLEWKGQAKDGTLTASESRRCDGAAGATATRTITATRRVVRPPS